MNTLYIIRIFIYFKFIKVISYLDGYFINTINPSQKPQVLLVAYTHSGNIIALIIRGLLDHGYAYPYLLWVKINSTHLKALIKAEYPPGILESCVFEPSTFYLKHG